ncbi:MAG: hypothetical protein QM817_23115 [Archangium sp.]
MKEKVEKTGSSEEKHSTWTRAGSAFMNRDGSINVYLDVLPIDGKLHVREPIVEKQTNNRAPTNGSSTTQQDAAFAAEANTQFGGH